MQGLWDTTIPGTVHVQLDIRQSGGTWSVRFFGRAGWETMADVRVDPAGATLSFRRPCAQFGEPDQTYSAKIVGGVMRGLFNGGYAWEGRLAAPSPPPPSPTPTPVQPTPTPTKIQAPNPPPVDSNANPGSAEQCEDSYAGAERQFPMFSGYTGSKAKLLADTKAAIEAYKATALGPCRGRVEACNAEVQISRLYGFIGDAASADAALKQARECSNAHEQ